MSPAPLDSTYPGIRVDKEKADVKENTYAKLHANRLMQELLAELEQQISYADTKYIGIDVASKPREPG